MDHLTAASSPTKLRLDFFSGYTVDIDMKEIDRRCISSRDLSNSHFPLSFFLSLNLLIPIRDLLTEALIPFRPWNSIF